VRGRAEWFLDSAPDEVEVTLFWHTSGKGTEDVEVVDSVAHAHPSSQGEMSFSFQLPAEPYSFSGTLITLAWAIEILTHSPDESFSETITVSPKDREIVLREVSSKLG
ncbi:MAG: hypothetical protein KDD55_14100, partial [Bdellovibrionales bacterium]|nr:hypothetical protein [Bdellovibrionales bacterium]